MVRSITAAALAVALGVACGPSGSEPAAEAPETPAGHAPRPLAASNLEQPETGADADRPKRRGWWQRRLTGRR